MASNDQASDLGKRQSPSECQPFLKSAIERYAGRQDELGERQRALNDRVGIMERSVPALMALSMLQSERGPGDALERVRALMERLAPKPDPADELAKELAECVQQLDRETDELHDKIINTEVQLEENCRKLESLEQENMELENQIHGLQNKLESCFNLEPISSNDRLCLAKIRRLGEEELRLKRSIRDYEEREVVLRCQIEKILGPNESKCRKICGEVHSQKHHVHKSKLQKKRTCRESEVPSDVESLFERKNCNTGCDALRQMINENDYKKLELPRKPSCEKVSKSSSHHGHRRSQNLRRLCNCDKVKKRKSYKESEFDEDANNSAKNVPVVVPEYEPQINGTTFYDVASQKRVIHLGDEGRMTVAVSKALHSAMINKDDTEFNTSQSTHIRILNEISKEPEEVVSNIVPQDDSDR